MVREFMPCIRKSDGAVGLYDFVEGVFYHNEGTGTFVAGPEISGIGSKNFNSNTLKEV
jgi:hypothetical protein